MRAFAAWLIPPEIPSPYRVTGGMCGDCPEERAMCEGASCPSVVP